MFPLLLVVLLWRLGVAEGVALVVGVDEVVDDGAGLPESDSSVGIFNGWHSAVDVDIDEWLLLQDRHVHVLGLVGNFELLEDDGDLPWVRALSCGE